MSAEFRMPTAPVGDDAEGRAKDMLDGARAKLGFVPNMYRGMAIAPGLLDTYLHGYDLFRSGSFTPPEQEVVFLTISRGNGCGYCMAAHSMLAANVSRLPQEETDAIRAGRAPSDPKLQAVHDFTRVMFETRGLPTQAQADAFKAAGYTDAHILEIVLALAVKTISNYANHVTHPPVDDAFAAFRMPETEDA